MEPQWWLVYKCDFKTNFIKFWEITFNYIMSCFSTSCLKENIHLKIYIIAVTYKNISKLNFHKIPFYFNLITS